MKYDVFISYSRKDYVDEQKNVIPDNVISIIKDKLIENNISYWMDEEGNLTGKRFAHIIAGKIRESMIFIFVCSKNSVSSRWVDRELSVADTLNKHIIPFVCDDSCYDDKVIMFTSSLDRIEYHSNPQKELDKLISAIKKDKIELEEKNKKERLKKTQEEDTVEEKSIEINWKHESLKRHLFEKRKGCYVTIIVLFLAVLIVLPLRMAFDSAQSASPVVVSSDSSESKNEQMSIVEHTDTLTIDLYLKYAVGSSKLVLDTIAKQKIDIVVKQIERRKANLKNIEIITGFSPEGSPAINQKLSKARAEVLADYLKTYIGDVETTVSCKERNWTDVSEILRKQGHISEADAIDGILQDTEHYMQIYTKIRQIPTYDELISPVLSKLRYTTCLLEVVRFEVRNSDMPL